MEKFIPYEKLSKKEKRKIDQARRQTWGELNPVTRKPENSKAYNRNKTRNWKRDYHEPVPGFNLFIGGDNINIRYSIENVLVWFFVFHAKFSTSYA